MEYILLLIGFVILVKGADLFVDGSSSLAKNFKVPPLMIGLTIVAFGTSAPEAAVSVSAALNQQNDIVLGNVFGSNIFNLLVVIGISALIAPIKSNKSIVKKEFPFSMLTCLVLFALGLDIVLGGATGNVISRGDGLILLLFFVIFLYSTITFALSNKTEATDDDSEIKKMSTGKAVILSVIGITGVILGGQLVVNNAVSIAEGFGVSQMVIGLTIVAIGTSLPELITSIVAAKKGESDLALGNVIGSNIFNTLFVIGVSSSITPISISNDAITDLIILTVLSLVTYFFTVSKKHISRLEGGILVAIYLGYMAYILVR